MPFGAILGLAGAGLQFAAASQSNAIAMQELQLRRKALRDQRDMAVLNYGLGLDQLRREREQERYNRMIREENAEFARQEYELRNDRYEQRLEQAKRERAYEIDRQVRADKDAAKQQKFMLEQYLRNTQLAEEERDFAIAQLEQARAVAEGERDEDLRRRAEEDLTARLEREFAVEELYRAQTVASQERFDDLAFRDDIIRRLDNMSTEIESAYETLGPLVAPDLLGREDFEQMLSRYEALNVQDVDRAVDRIASQNEASLMTRGLENSSIGQSARADVGARMAPEYERARLGAIQQAMSYITGLNENEMMGWNAMAQARDRSANEIMNMRFAPIEAMLQANTGVGSANDYSAPVPIGTGMSARGVQSANNFRAPVSVNSATFTQGGIGSGMSNYMAPSVAEAFVYDAGTRAVGPAAWNISSPQGYLSNAASLQSNIPGHYNPESWAQNASNMMNAGVGTLGGVGGALDGFLSEGGWGSNWSRPSGPVGTPAYAPTPVARPPYRRSYGDI